LKSIILSLFKDQYNGYFLIFVYLVTKLVIMKLVTKLVLIKLIIKLVWIYEIGH